MEVVVNVHAGRTTTSEAEARFRSNAANIQEVVVTHYTKKPTTTLTQPQPQQSRWMSSFLEHSHDDVHTAFSKLTTVEEGIRGKTPSYEISFPAEQLSI